jgi:hypothetical protein
LIVCLCGVVFAQKAAPDQEKAAQAAAEIWLALVDAAQYNESWEQAASFFKASVAKDDWNENITQARQPLGKFKTRKVKYTQATDTVQGAPKGKYVLLQTEAAFANQADAKELITVTLDKDGQWRVVGYFIR